MVGGRSVPLIPSIVERVRSGPEQSGARGLLARRSATLDGEDRCETITEGRKEPLSNSAYPLQSPNSHKYCSDGTDVNRRTWAGEQLIGIRRLWPSDAHSNILT